MSSVQERLRAAREAKLDRAPIKLRVPGWSGSGDAVLVAVYRPVDDWASVQAFMRTLDPQKELEVAADTLLSACQGCEAHVDGEVLELSHKLGVDLAGYLGEDVNPVGGVAITDRQALFMLIPSETKLMMHYDALMRESGIVGEDVNDQIVGESQAS